MRQHTFMSRATERRILDIAPNAINHSQGSSTEIVAGIN